MHNNNIIFLFMIYEMILFRVITERDASLQTSRITYLHNSFNVMTKTCIKYFITFDFKLEYSKISL